MCEKLKPGHVYDYAPEVRSLLRALKAAGLVIEKLSNGDEYFLAPASESDLISEILGADDCRLMVRCPDGKARGVYLVFGNSPGELVCDYVTGCPVLSAAITAEGDKWDGKAQPTRFCQSTADLQASNARAAAYSKHYAACQAGGMSAGASHEYASELSQREGGAK